MVDFRKELNREQLKVVYEGDGPCLVLSGPGSGKTRTLVYRTAFLLERGVNPSRILLLTFTKKAAKEMLSRIHQLFPKGREKIYGGTFHHAGNLFLRRYASRIGYDPGFIIIDQEDSKSLLKEIIKDISKESLPKAPVIQSIISLSVNAKKETKQVIEEQFPYFNDLVVEKIEEIKKRYKERKKRGNLMDYDDLLEKWNEILFFEDIQKEIGEQFFYILIDEYQDTNALQDEIVRKISDTHGNILAVGDDSQSIYSFRAANIENILNFPKNYPQCKTFRLEKNYRSTPQIVDIANRVIENNKRRLQKKLESVKKEGIFPETISFSSSFEQARFIAEYLKKEKSSLASTAVLFRAHFHSLELEMELVRKKIPYIMRGGVRFAEQFHVKDLMAFLRIYLNHHDETSLKRILLRQEGIGEVSASKIIEEITQKKTLKEAIKDKESIKKSTSSQKSGEGVFFLLSLLEKGIEKEIDEKISIFREEFYDQYLNFSFENAKERRGDLKRITELSEKYEDLHTMVSDFSLSETFKEEESDEKETLTLSTIHQAKGLEWETVFIISLKERDFPHSKSIDEELLEEERRLFYVAITRCKERLFLTYPLYSSRDKKIGIPSRFLSEGGLIDEEIIEEKEDGDWEVF